MIIYNVTFLVENRDEERFLKWIRCEGRNIMVAGHLAAIATAAGNNPRLSKVVDVPGDPEFAAQACSFAFQMEFPDMESAKRWENEVFPKAISSYTALFGEERALVFSTIMEKIEL